MIRGAKRAAGLAVMAMTITAGAAEKLFDPGRDPEKDLKKAERQAQAEHKNILMDVGGNWCPWCILLDRTLNQDADLHEILKRNYVVLRVNWSQENQNAAFLGRYPKPKGFPAWYVLSPDGQLLKAEDTSELEQTHELNAGYNRETVKAFLSANAPHQVADVRH